MSGKEAVSCANEANEEYETTASGASATIPTQCSALRKNGHVVMKGHPCKIVDMSTSKTGKHGHAKVKLTGLDIFTGKKYEDICPSTHNMEVPNVIRKEYIVMSLNDGFFSLLDENNQPVENLKIEEFTKPNDPEDIQKLLDDAEANGVDLLATVLKTMGSECVVSFKKGS